MATQDDYIRTALRVPPELHAKIHESAKANNRTFNAEIVARLKESFYVKLGAAATIELKAEGRPSNDPKVPNSDEIAQKVVDKLIPLIGVYTREQLEAITPDYAKPSSKKNQVF